MLTMVRAPPFFPAEANSGRTTCVRDLREDGFAGMAQGTCPCDALLFGSQEACLCVEQGPQGPKTLCNACGLRWAKKARKNGDGEGEADGAQNNGSNIVF